MSEAFDPEILSLLERRYLPGEEQKCRGCGGALRYLYNIGPEIKAYRCAGLPDAFESLLAWSRHIEGNDLFVGRKPDREVRALIDEYRRLTAGRSETLRQALELIEHLGRVLDSDEVLLRAQRMRMEEAELRPYQPQLRWAPYQEFASDPGLEAMEPPAGRVTVMATGYRDNYVIIYWAGEDS